MSGVSRGQHYSFHTSFHSPQKHLCNTRVTLSAEKLSTIAKVNFGSISLGIKPIVEYELSVTIHSPSAIPGFPVLGNFKT